MYWWKLCDWSVSCIWCLSIHHIGCWPTTKILPGSMTILVADISTIILPTRSCGSGEIGIIYSIYAKSVSGTYSSIFKTIAQNFPKRLPHKDFVKWSSAIPDARQHCIIILLTWSLMKKYLIFIWLFCYLCLPSVSRRIALWLSW